MLTLSYLHSSLQVINKSKAKKKRKLYHRFPIQQVPQLGDRQIKYNEEKLIGQFLK